MPAKSDVVLSCIQPTAEMHLGNYFGAVRNWARLQDEYDCVYGVVDLHAMTMPFKAKDLRENTVQMFIEMLACGIDPERSDMFVQSLIPEHSELAWILSCFCPFGDLSRMTQFKDKSSLVEEKSDEFISAGLFTYPVLQAADILVYRAKYVPVGKDQVQHLELSRVISRRFNNYAGREVLPEPGVLLSEMPKIMSLADPTKKMSKSLGPKHCVGLFEEEKVVRKKIKSAVTDTGEEDGSNELSAGVKSLLQILRACGKSDEASEFEAAFAIGPRRYAPLKECVADAVVELTTELRERRAEFAADREGVMRIITEHSGQDPRPRRQDAGEGSQGYRVAGATLITRSGRRIRVDHDMIRLLRRSIPRSEW